MFSAKRLETATEEEVGKYLSSLGYREDGLVAAHTVGHEVMLYCERYIAIPMGAAAGGLAG
jgi:hypothetical protein